jgi:hypothetical protein
VHRNVVSGDPTVLEGVILGSVAAVAACCTLNDSPYDSVNPEMVAGTVAILVPGAESSDGRTIGL